MQEIEIINKTALFNAAERLKGVCEQAATEYQNAARERNLVYEIDLASVDLALAAGRVSTEQHAKAQAEIHERNKSKLQKA